MAAMFYDVLRFLIMPCREGRRSGNQRFFRRTLGSLKYALCLQSRIVGLLMLRYAKISNYYALLMLFTCP